ncbi:MAG: acyl carrier protein [Butyrivibrio sp.]|uniref:acyl carrier protein n=1 Tax=Butyrivibrio sp. TaxID=28121 RepID=UPI0025F74E2D|nr:acyl carrier protein [Butyrivibrio sp.]MCR5771731.1 acyl carrier protein [Butyrivibrio sp.]
MKTEKIFKNLLAQYCDIEPKDMKNDMRLTEDLGLSSFDLMSFLGDMEDNFDIEIDPENLANVTTLSEALQLVNLACQEA